VFFLLAFLFSWIFWIPAALSGASVASGPGRWLLHAGAFGPLIATLIRLAPARMREARHQWWRRLTGIGALASPSGLLCVLVPVLIAQLSLDGYAATGGIALPRATAGEALALLAPAFLFMALPAELAWRGYALPSMIRHREPVMPTVLLGACWGAWLLPLFFMKGTYQAGIEIFSVVGLLFFLNLIAQSLLMTTFYLATRCTWTAVLFHGLTDFMGELWQMPAGAEVHRALWTLLLAGAVLMLRSPLGIQLPRARAEDRSTEGGEPRD